MFPVCVFYLKGESFGTLFVCPITALALYLKSFGFGCFLSQFLSLSVCLAALCNSVDKCVFHIICIIRLTLGSVPASKTTQNIKEAHFTELNTLSKHRRHMSHCLKPPDVIMVNRWCGMVRG